MDTVREARVCMCRKPRSSSRTICLLDDEEGGTNCNTATAFTGGGDTRGMGEESSGGGQNPTANEEVVSESPGNCPQTASEGNEEVVFPCNWLWVGGDIQVLTCGK